MNLKYIIIICVAVVSVWTAVGQNRPSMPAKPRQQVLDTLATSDPQTQIVIYDNNTWNYHTSGPGAPSKAELAIFTENWVNDHVFAYREVHLNDLPPVIELHLISSLKDFHYPILGRVFSKYGRRGRRNHNGVDIPLKIGEPIYATFDGKVRYTRYNTGGYGNLVILRHKNGLETWYAHLSGSNVQVDQYVNAGDVIGFGGNTGRSRGPHLHFEVRYADQTFDPEYLFDFESGQIKYQTFALEKGFFNIHSRASDQLEEHDEFDNFLLAAENEEGASEDILELIAKAQSTSTGSTISQSNAVYYTVKQGDVLGRIASKNGVSIEQICRLNGISRTTVLRIGRTLRVR